MDLTEALALIGENLDDEAVKKFMQPHLDRYFAKSLETWKANHLPEEITKAMQPPETEDAKRARELQSELDKVNLKGELQQYARKKGVSDSIADFLPADKEQALKIIDFHLENVKAAVQPVQVELDTLKAKIAMPGGGGAATVHTLSSVSKLPPAEMMDALEAHPEILKGENRGQ